MARPKPAGHPLIIRMDYEMKMRGVSDEEMATALRIKLRTLQDRRKHPERFKLPELERMEAKLKVPLDELRGKNVECKRA